MSARGDLGSFGPVVEAMYQARHAAIDRMIAECAAFGGHGVVGVRLPRGSFALGRLEFRAIGTASRAPGAAPGRRRTPFTRKRAVFHGALGYAVETRLLESNPADRISWRAPPSLPCGRPAIVASPAQAQVLLGALTRIRPDLTAFFGCLYYAALRPEEAIALRSCDCRFAWPRLGIAHRRDRRLPAHRRRVDR